MATTGPARRTPASRSPRLPGGAPALTPRVAWRIAALGAIVLIGLGVLFLRLWFLQVIGGSEYQAAANANRLRTVVSEAPRGVIEDRDGALLVSNRASEDVVVRPQDLRGRRARVTMTRLAPVLKTTPAALLGKLRRAASTPYQAVVLAEDVDPEVQLYLSERHAQFPGVALQKSWVRTYPHGATAAQVLGYVGAIQPGQLPAYRRQGVDPDESVGQSGLELEYQRYLRGQPGVTKVEVDAAGEPVGRRIISATPPRSGDTLRVSIDLRTQRALETSLANQVALAGYSHGAAGVALDPRTGEILALASYPTYDPKVFTQGKPGPLRELRANPDTPELDRAIQGLYPAGSAFKPIAAIAAMRTLGPKGTPYLTPDETIDSPSEITLYKQRFKSLADNLGPINLTTALEVSSDTFFYQIGDRFFLDKGSPLQDWARKFGLGHDTGIDLPGEAAGLVPTPAWKRQQFSGPNFAEIDRIWKPGDTITLAIGQSYLQVTPLQMATAYAAIANGGTVVTPTLGREVLDQNGARLRNLVAGRPTSELAIPADELDTVRQGLYLAANGSVGTSTPVFGNLPLQDKAAGKTGTAQNPQGQDHSWWVGYAPASDPKIVVAVVVENSGRGASYAAPVACRTFAAYLRFSPARCGDGSGTASR